MTDKAVTLSAGEWAYVIAALQAEESMNRQYHFHAFAKRNKKIRESIEKQTEESKP